MKKSVILNNKKLFVVVKGNESLGYVPRFYWSKGTKRYAPSVLVKCGCCNNKVRVYYNGKFKLGKKIVHDDLIAINDVLAHKDFWKLLFEKIGLIEKRKED